MEKSTTPKHRIELRTNDLTVMEDYPWDSKHYGAATDENLEEWRNVMNASFQPGGVNEHITDARGVVPHIIAAKLIHQSTNAVSAETEMAVFELV
jgi:hypothetical protein